MCLGFVSSQQILLEIFIGLDLILPNAKKDKECHYGSPCPSFYADVPYCFKAPKMKTGAEKQKNRA
jgi:hypothetical protein